MVGRTPVVWFVPLRSLAWGLVAVVLAAGMWTMWTRRAPGAPAAATAEAAPFVLIDPGHGGIDGGAGAGGVLEKDVTLAVALQLRAELGALGVPAQMTRDTDVDLGGSRTRGRHGRDLAARLQQAGSPGARILVSLHANADTRPGAKGTLLLYPKHSAVSQSVAQRLRDRLREAGIDAAAPIGRTNLFLLRKSPVPAVLVEMGFLTNPDDRAHLQDPAFRQRMARAMAMAVQGAYTDISATH